MVLTLVLTFALVFFWSFYFFPHLCFFGLESARLTTCTVVRSGRRHHQRRSARAPLRRLPESWPQLQVGNDTVMESDVLQRRPSGSEHLPAGTGRCQRILAGLLDNGQPRTSGICGQHRGHVAVQLSRRVRPRHHQEPERPGRPQFSSRPQTARVPVRWRGPSDSWENAQRARDRCPGGQRRSSRGDR